jgi:chromate transporter
MLKNLLDLYITFFKIGAVTFGGGYAMLPVLDRELAQKKKWVSGDDLLDYYAVSQVTPGVIAVNVSTFVGSKKAGIAGGIAATAGVVSPSIIIITVIALFISSFEKIVWVQKALAGVNVAVTALLSYAGFNFAKKAVKNWWGLLIYACSFCAVFFYKIPSVAVVLLALAVGLLIHFVCVGASGKGACGVAEEAGGVAKDAGGSPEASPANTAPGSTKDASGSSEEAVAFANRAIGLQKDAIAPTPAASAKVPADLPQKNKSKN